MPKTLSESILQSKPITAAGSLLKTFKGSLLRSQLITVALGLTLALTAWTLIQAVVGDLIAPLIAVFIGESHFELNTFTIGESKAVLRISESPYKQEVAGSSPAPPIGCGPFAVICSSLWQC